MAKNDLETIGMENLTEFCVNCGWPGPTEHTRIVDEDTGNLFFGVSVAGSAIMVPESSSTSRAKAGYLGATAALL